MNTLTVMCIIWGVITVGFVALLLYRANINKDEKDWIPLTMDAKEESAIEAQKVSEMKAGKLKVPIRALGFLSLAMLLVIVGLWMFHALFGPPTMPQ